MTITNLSFRVSSLHINLDIKKDLTARNMKIERSLQAEVRITDALKGKEVYLRDFSMNPF